MKPDTRSFYVRAAQAAIEHIARHLDDALELEALARLAFGAAAFLAVAIAGCLATRALLPADVRELLALLRGRPVAEGEGTA